MLNNYERDLNCECSKFKDREKMSISDRMSCNSFWMRGRIHENGISRECSCHKNWRLTRLYNIISNQFNLPNSKELQDLQYYGQDDSFKKLQVLPSIISEKKLQDVLVIIYGNPGCQKTTSLAQLTQQLILKEYSVQYITFPDLIDLFSDKTDSRLKEISTTDWLLIDDCFSNITVNFRSNYNAFYNLILSRRKPTVLSADFDIDQLPKMTSSPFYNETAIQKVFSRVDIYKTKILFKENVSKMKVVGINGDKVIDIWSM